MAWENPVCKLLFVPLWLELLVFLFLKQLKSRIIFVFTKNSQKAAARYSKMIKLSLFEAGWFMFIHHVMHQICFPKSTLELLYFSVDSEMQKMI